MYLTYNLHPKEENYTVRMEEKKFHIPQSVEPLNFVFSNSKLSLRSDITAKGPREQTVMIHKFL